LKPVAMSMFLSAFVFLVESCHKVCGPPTSPLFRFPMIAPEDLQCPPSVLLAFLASDGWLHLSLRSFFFFFCLGCVGCSGVAVALVMNRDPLLPPLALLPLQPSSLMSYMTCRTFLSSHTQSASFCAHRFLLFATTFDSPPPFRFLIEPD